MEKQNKTEINDMQRADYAEKLKNYSMMNDVFFRAFIRDNKPAAELIFKIILQKDVEVTDIETQRDMKNLKGRSAAFDFYGKVDGKPADIEIENSRHGADFHRSRYHSSLLDSDSLRPGQDFTDLPDTYVVFVTAKDVIGYGDAYYLIERVIKRRNVDVNDGSHIIYINGEYRDQSELGWLIHDFNESDPEKMHYSILQKTAKFLKQTEKGVAIMYNDMDELRSEGAKETKNDVALTMIQNGEPDEKIVLYTKLTKQQVKELREKTKDLVMA